MRSPLFLISVFALATVSTAHAATLHVPGQYSTISAAVAVAASGDTISVDGPSTTSSDGTYRESVTVGVPNLEINGHNGATMDGSVFSPTTFPLGITVQSERVTIKGLAIRNYSVGINVMAGGSRNVLSNTISNCGTGILCSTGTSTPGTGIKPLKKTLVDGNVVTSCGTGVDLESSENVTVSNNAVVSNGSDPNGLATGIGVLVQGCTRCALDDNLITLSVADGVFVALSDTLRITSNVIDCNGVSGTGNGIWFNVAVTKSTIDRNELDGNSGDGIVFDVFSTDNTVTRNESNHNGQDGILMNDTCIDNTITHNTALGNANLDAEDKNAVSGANNWKDNVFGTTAGF